MAQVGTQRSCYTHDNAFSTYVLLKDKSAMTELFKVISGKGFFEWLSNLFNRASDSIGSIRIYPMIRSKLRDFNTSLTFSVLKMGGKDWMVKHHTHNVQNYRYEVGKKVFAEANSFIQFEPYTQISLHLPFLDFIDLPVNELRGKTMYVYYTFDYASGTATAFIEVQSNTDRYILATKTGKVGVDVAWGKDNSVENSRNIINTAISTAISLATIYATKGTSAVAQGVAGARAGAEVGKSLLSIANSTQTRFERGGTVGSYGSIAFDNFKPYLIIKRPKLVPVDETEYARIYGKPLYESRVLAQVSGFTIVDDIHLENLGEATEPEMREIEMLLKQGVHL